LTIELADHGSITILKFEQGKELTIAFSDGVEASFGYFWLRDHSTDVQSFDFRSSQRETFTAGLDSDVHPNHVKLGNAGESLIVTWPDVGDSVYDAAFLHQVCSAEHDSLQSYQRSWDAATISNAANTFTWQLAPHQKTAMLGSLVTDGFVRIADCPVDSSSVKQIADMFGYPRATIYGDIWSFDANEEMSDTAYTTKALRPHTDGTYSYDAPGLQLLLCLDYQAQGGQSVLVDGFNIYQRMKKDVPDDARTLAEISVPGQYVGDGVHLVASRPVFACSAQGLLRQVSFNNYDRAPFMLDSSTMARFYRALRSFERYANDPAMQWRHTLLPGEMIIFDNWRLLHGRKSFTGQRGMTGCYINREDFESCIRLGEWPQHHSDG
jgi:trimethyllysine dioxygenase